MACLCNVLSARVSDQGLKTQFFVKIPTRVIIVIVFSNYLFIVFKFHFDSLVSSDNEPVLFTLLFNCLLF